MDLGLRSHPPAKRPAPNTVEAGLDASAIQGRLGARVALLQSPIPRAAPRTCGGEPNLSSAKLTEDAPPTYHPDRMTLWERNGDRTDPWAFGWPDLKIGLRALLWPDWKRYSVLRTGCTDSRLSQAFMPALCQRRRSRMQHNSTVEKGRMRKTN